MKPVLILQNMRHDGPAYLAQWLHRHGIAFELRDASAPGATVGESTADNPFPRSMDGYAALAILGGAMSANDPLPFLRQAERLILESVKRGLPVIGHCLGGQLMANALGARVRASPAPEIGWQPLQVLDHPQAKAWFGPEAAHSVMHWHYESFDLPDGAQWLARSDACPHQAFSLGPHLAMQFHIEIDDAKLRQWLDDGDPSWAGARLRHAGSVQSKEEILAQSAQRMPGHQALADRLYAHWMEGVRAAAGPV